MITSVTLRARRVGRQACCLATISLAWLAAGSLVCGARAGSTTAKAPAKAERRQAAAKPKAEASPGKALPVAVGFGAAGLPVNVAEMREAILAAATSGEIDELMVPIQWNELPPDFGAASVKQAIAQWKKASRDGSGREMLALIAEILSSPYAVRRQGADIENARIYIWPAFAELALDRLPPPLEVALLRLVSPEEAQRMKQLGHYDGFGIAIGADGTWHALKRVRKAPSPGEK